MTDNDLRAAVTRVRDDFVTRSEMPGTFTGGYKEGMKDAARLLTSHALADAPVADDPPPAPTTEQRAACWRSRDYAKGDDCTTPVLMGGLDDFASMLAGYYDGEVRQWLAKEAQGE